MGVTGKTHNKLFKVRTYNPQNLYQVGVNGVTGVDLNTDDDSYTITYELDGITYKTKVGSLEGKSGQDKNEPRTSIINLDKGTISYIKLADYGSPTSNGIGRTGDPSKELDTIYETNGFSFDNFMENKIVKREELIGLIDNPITESELFIERDEFTVFERHQRLSEINDLASLINYRNGYYEIVNTL